MGRNFDINVAVEIFILTSTGEMWKGNSNYQQREASTSYTHMWLQFLYHLFQHKCVLERVVGLCNIAYSSKVRQICLSARLQLSRQSIERIDETFTIYLQVVFSQLELCDNALITFINVINALPHNSYPTYHSWWVQQRSSLRLYCTAKEWWQGSNCCVNQSCIKWHKEVPQSNVNIQHIDK